MADGPVIIQLAARTYKVGLLIGWAGSGAASRDIPIYRIDGKRFGTLFSAEAEINRRKEQRKT